MRLSAANIGVLELRAENPYIAEVLAGKSGAAEDCAPAEEKIDPCKEGVEVGVEATDLDDDIASAGTATWDSFGKTALTGFIENETFGDIKEEKGVVTVSDVAASVNEEH